MRDSELNVFCVLKLYDMQLIETRVVCVQGHAAGRAVHRIITGVAEAPL